MVFDSKKGGERVLRRFEVWVFGTLVVYVDQLSWKGEGWIPGLVSTCWYCWYCWYVEGGKCYLQETWGGSPC